MGRRRRDSRLWALVASGSRYRRPFPSPVPPPGVLPSGTPSPGTSSLGPLGRLLPRPRCHSGQAPSPHDWCPGGTLLCLAARPLLPASRLYSRAVRPAFPALSPACNPVWVRRLKESGRNSLFASPPGGTGRARLGPHLSAPRGPWMARQQRNRGGPCPCQVHLADPAQLELRP